jgi:hypothetical protein
LIVPETAERIAWGACGVLSFIVLIVWLRVDTPEDEKKVRPPEVPRRREHFVRGDQMASSILII